MKIDEQELILRAIEGDKDAFGMLVEKYKSVVYALAYESTRNAADAEDISQEAFIKAYLKLSTLRDRTKFAAWLRQITHSLCVDWQRKQARKREVPFGEIAKVGGQGQSFANMPKTPEEELEQKGFRETILAALESLSFKNRLTVMMYYMNGLSYREIASFQGVPFSTIKGRLYQARKQLKKELIVLMEETLKIQAPGKDFTQAVLKDLELVQQELGGGKAWLIAKEERTGAISCGAVADLDGDGKSEIILGTRRGYVLAFDASGDLLWRYAHAQEIQDVAITEARQGTPGEVVIGANGILLLDSRGQKSWFHPAEGQAQKIAIMDLSNGEYRIGAWMNLVRIFDRNGNLNTEYTLHEIKAMTVGDLTGDGVPEIVISSCYGVWVFSYKGYSADNRQGNELLWRFNLKERGYNSWFEKLVIADINADGEAELVAGSREQLVAFDKKGEEMWKCEVQGPKKSIAVGDVNSDSKSEIAVLVNRKAYLLNHQGKILWNADLDGKGCMVEIVDLNDDGEAEIIIGSDGQNPSVFVFDGKGKLQWQYPLSSGVSALVCRDIDSDGSMEVVAASSNLHVLSHLGNVKWVYHSGEDFAVAVGDIDSDGVAEILIGSSAVTAYKGDGKALWQYETPAVHSLSLECSDDGKVKQIAVGCREGICYLLNPDGSLKHQLRESRGSIAVAFVDINEDGEREVVVLSSETLQAFDAKGNRLWKQGIGEYNQEGQVFLPWSFTCMAIGNLNPSLNSHIVAAYLPGGVRAFSGTGEELWSYMKVLPSRKVDAAGLIWPNYKEMEIISLTTCDLDLDGYDEVIGVSTKEVYCFKGDGSLLWEIESPYPPPQVSKRKYGDYRQVSCADINGDGQPFLITAIAGITVYSRQGEELWHAPSSGAVWDIIVGDVNSDNIPEIVVASDELEVFSADGRKLFSYGEAGKFYSVALGDVDDDGVLEIVAGGAGVYVFKMS